MENGKRLPALICRIRPLALCVLLFVLAPGVSAQPSAASAATSAPSTITWQSLNSTFNEVPAEFARLYASLAAFGKEGGSVATKNVTVKKGQSIEAALRDNGVFAGNAMPVQVDLYVCGLNPTVCKTTNGKALWTIQPDAELVVPDIQLQPITVLRPYNKSAGDTLEGLVRDRRSCDVIDEACVLFVKNVNRRRQGEIDASYSGPLTMPTRAYRATITPAGRAASTVADPLSLPGMAGMRRNAVPSLDAKLQAQPALAPAGEATRSQVMRWIGYPRKGSEAFDLPSTGMTHVTVIDNWVDAAHCMLKNVRPQEPPAPTAGTRPACGGRGDAMKARDHGTHVVGLIAAMTDSEAGPGINPRAIVNTMAVDFDQLTNVGYATALRDRFLQLYSTDAAPDVVNMSFEYTVRGSGDNDVVWSAIDSLRSDTLFVVAAGNSMRALARGNSCNVRPACQNAPHVLTVGALSSSDAPTLYQDGESGSNFGTAVHVAAPGSKIVSTIAMNRWGVLSGTSQAAPLVTGVASLIYLKDRKLRPEQVKNRIIYTSDLFPALYPKMLGGRLNAQRALEFEQAQVLLKGKELQRLTLRDGNAAVTFGDYDNQNAEFRIRFGQVRRLKFEPTLNQHVLYYTPDANKDSGELQRKFVRVKGASLAFALAEGPAQPIVKINLSEVDDYTSAIVR